MKTSTMRELKHHTAKVLAWAEAGEEVELTRRGKPVARLSPAKGRRKTAKVDFLGRLTAIYGDKMLKQTATELLSEARGDR